MLSASRMTAVTPTSREGALLRLVAGWSATSIIWLRHRLGERSPLGEPGDRTDHQGEGADPAIQHRQGDPGPFHALAQLDGQVHQPGEGQQPDGDADGHLGRRANIPGGGIDHGQGGLEPARGDRDQPQPIGGLELGGDARPWTPPERVHSRRM
jgi:hypothetical protein